MSTPGSTIASSTHADESDLTSLSSVSPTTPVTIINFLPGQGKQPLPSRGKPPATETKAATPKWLQNYPLRRLYNSKEIISIGNMPSNAQLKSMNSKPFISIRWKGGDGDEPIMLYEAFPKALAIAFSEVCRQSNGSSVIIVGGSYQRIKKIFDYMLESAKGQGCAPPPIPRQLRYCTYVREACYASHVSVPLLQDEYEARWTIIENMQVHSEDIEEIYRDDTSKGTFARENAARSVARKMASKTLKAYSVYMKLREELPEFDADVKKALIDFRKPLEEEKRRLMREMQQQAQRQAWVQQQRGARQAQVARREKAAVVPHMDTVPPNKAPPARNLQPWTAERVQTSLGVIWAEIPVDRGFKGKAAKDPAKKKVTPAKEVSELNESAAKDTDDKKSTVSWADEMTELSEEERKSAENGRVKVGEQTGGMSNAREMTKQGVVGMTGKFSGSQA